ncbi:MAG: RHS repeat-associated core domain-containing protein [Bacteroidetes bacterium]|nr:MAG: RHS repeat-associated core domain-containing protein [Bacteroidota bacterium]
MKSAVRVEAVRAVTVTDTYDYTAFGEIDAQTGTTPNTYLYTGQQYDAETGLYSLRARYYNPSDGRFLSRDTYAYNYQNPIELNRYAYAANNPITNYDPSGQFALMGYDRTISDISRENIPILSLPGKGVLFLWNVVWWSLRFLIAISPVLATLGPLVSPNTAPPPLGSVWDPYNQNNWDLWRDTAPPDVVVDPPTIPCSGGSRCDANPYDDTIPEYENPTEHSRETNEETSARQQREGPRYADPPQPPPEENRQDFDIAFGIAPLVFVFAASFERKTLTWMVWPDWMIASPSGKDLIPIMQPAVYKAEFDYIMGLYFAAIPHGRIKFNLSEMDNSQPDSLTIWELKITRTKYKEKTDYYEFDAATGHKRQLIGSKLEVRINEILS